MLIYNGPYRPIDIFANKKKLPAKNHHQPKLHRNRTMKFSTAKKILPVIATVGLISFPQPSQARHYNHSHDYEETCTNSRTVPVWKARVIDSHGYWLPGRYEMETFVEYVPCYKRTLIYTPAPFPHSINHHHSACTRFGWSRGNGSKYHFKFC